jgi:NADH:ubiquinone reductase (non-electrogenic)
MRSSKKHPEWNFFQAACLDIDANTKTLTCEERAVRESEHRVFKLNYDKLVVTIGADNNTYNIPGVQENTYFLKELDDARKIRQKIIECFERASIPGTSGEERSKLLNFVIVGGGPTGVEFAGELSDFFWEDLRHYFPTIPVNEVRFTLVEASTTILGAFHKALVDHAMVTIKRQGVDIRTHSLVKEVRKNEVHLADGTVIPCGLIVWSTGVGPRDLAKKLGWQKTKQGRFIVDDHLRVMELKDVYAAGDCAEIEANPLPATAQVAQQQGRYIAKAFNTMAKDPQATVDPFKFHYLGITTYVGSNKSLIDMDTVQMSGLIAWLGWRSAYLTRLGSWRNKLMVPLNWTRTMLFGRDISNF